ncbi:MAG: hypothetical protein PQJ46_02140, partial [Spirochaetales bacterium]|nr:hypothetical protein [Spirochaetales bacterium]
GAMTSFKVTSLPQAIGLKRSTLTITSDKKTYSVSLAVKGTKRYWKKENNTSTKTTWGKRAIVRSVAYNNKIWIIGGCDQNFCNNNKIWNSVDGKNWTEISNQLTETVFKKRTIFQSVVYDNKIWILGGFDGSIRYNDVWYSCDGISWTKITDSAAWTVRGGFQSIVFNNKIWVLGGIDSSGKYLQDVWYSENGIKWTLATDNAAWSGRRTFQSVVYNNKLWVLGGVDSCGKYLQDVWYSKDGIKWALASNSIGLSVSTYLRSVAYEGKLWVIDGLNGNLWNSVDGKNWKNIYKPSCWYPRFHFQNLVYDNKIWVLGGYACGNGYNYDNDVWSW